MVVSEPMVSESKCMQIGTHTRPQELTPLRHKSSIARMVKRQTLCSLHDVFAEPHRGAKHAHYTQLSKLKTEPQIAFFF
jgi:hypothetical protein